MPVEAKPLFRPDVLRPHLLANQRPSQNLPDIKAKLAKWAAMFQSRRANKFKEKELTRDFYDQYSDMRHKAFDQLCRENPTVSRHELLSATQKLLDRILFVSFCEDRGLLPSETIKHAYEHRDPYHPRPIWDNFRGLFRAIDTGNAGLNIPPYNGGLFAIDAGLDDLKLMDGVCHCFRELRAYDYRPARFRRKRLGS